MKRIIASLGAAALTLSMALPAAAATSVNANDDSWVGLFMHKFSKTIVTNSNTAVVTNVVTSASNTGGNMISAKEDVEGASITTGDAMSATEVGNDVNTISSEVTVNEGCGCEEGGDLTVAADDDSATKVKKDEASIVDVLNANGAAVTNAAAAGSDTGNNKIMSWHDDVEVGTVRSGVSTSGVLVGNILNKVTSKVIRLP
jgi:hypothetical protein